MPSVKIWGGTHPDEKAAMAVSDSLEKHPIPNVDTGIANPLARKLGKRLVDINLVGSFPGNSNAPEYESRRAVEVLSESQGFDVVVDLHNINGYGENTGCIDRQRGVSPRVLGLLGSLGIRHLVTTDYDGMHKYLPNAFVLETLTSGLGSDIEQLRSAFDRLANDPTLPTANAADFTWFSHVGSPHVDTVTPDVLSPEMRKNLHGFDILPQEIATALGYPDKKVCLMGWLDEPNEHGYWGELCELIPTPDGIEWPRD